jgi:hypothetical protein
MADEVADDAAAQEKMQFVDREGVCRGLRPSTFLTATDRLVVTWT